MKSIFFILNIIVSLFLYMDRGFALDSSIQNNPLWMPVVKSIYQCDLGMSDNKSCLAKTEGVGFILYTPARNEVDGKDHYFVVTDAHLSNGNQAGSLAMKIVNNSKDLFLKPKIKNNIIQRFSHNVLDIDIIEIEPPETLKKEQVFILDVNSENFLESNIIIKENEVDPFQKIEIGENHFVVKPENLQSRAVGVDWNAYYNNSDFVDDLKLSREAHEQIIGLSMNYGAKEYVSQSHIVGGMSGSPLLEKKGEQYFIKGISKRYHRLYPKSYFTTKEFILRVLHLYYRFYLIKDSSHPLPDISTIVNFEWSYAPGVGTFIKNKKENISELPQQMMNSGNSEILNSGMGHDTADGTKSSIALLNSKKFPLGLNYKGQNVIAFDVSIPEFWVDNNKIAAQHYQAYASSDSLFYLMSLNTQLQVDFQKNVDLRPIALNKELLPFLKNKIDNEKIIYDSFNDTITDLSDFIPNPNVSKFIKKEPSFLEAGCIINYNSFLDAKNKSQPSIQIALVRKSAYDSTDIKSIRSSYYSIQAPLNISWQKSVSSDSSNELWSQNKNEPELIFENKGLFFINFLDVNCTENLCDNLTILKDRPYLTYKWKEDSESSLAACRILKDDTFFKEIEKRTLFTVEL